MLFAWFALVLAGLALVWMRAARAQYLVVLHGSRYGWFFLERCADGRYQLFSPLWAPVVLLRYCLLSVALVLLSLQRRAVAWAHSHAPFAASAKI